MPRFDYKSYYRSNYKSNYKSFPQNDGSAKERTGTLLLLMRGARSISIIMIG